MSRMLLSIKPKYVNEIIAGKKRYEFRKFHCREGIDTIIIYATAPIKKVVAEVPLLDIVEGDVETVWKQTKLAGGITHKDYREYYKKRAIATAYHLGIVIQYDDPLDLSDFGLHYVPQSFAYVE